MCRMDRRRWAPRLVLPLLLAVLLALSFTSEARKLRSARLSPSASSSLLGMPQQNDASATKRIGRDDEPAPTLLFTLQSESAFLQLGELPTESQGEEAAETQESAAEATANDADFDRGTLTLRGVSPMAVWFAERPERAAGVLPTAELASEALDVDVDASGDQDEDRPKEKAWLGVPNVALTGTAARRGAGGGSDGSSSSSSEAATEETVTAVLTVLGRPRYDEEARTLTADVRVVPMKVSGRSNASPRPGGEASAATMTTSLPPQHSPTGRAERQRQPRSLTLTRAALLIDQLPMSEGYIGNNYGFANDCLSTMSPSCSPFAGTGYYRPGFVGWLGGQYGPGNVPRYPPSRGWQSPPSAPPSGNGNQSPPSSPPPPPPNSDGNSGQVYLMNQPYDPSKG